MLIARYDRSWTTVDKRTFQASDIATMTLHTNLSSTQVTAIVTAGVVTLVPPTPDPAPLVDPTWTIVHEDYM